MAIVFDPPAGLLAQCPNLQVIHSMVRSARGAWIVCLQLAVCCNIKYW